MRQEFNFSGQSRTNIAGLIACHKGGGGIQYTPPLPPAPTTAADNIAKVYRTRVRTRAKGYEGTVLAGRDQNPAQTAKTLLGT